MKHLLKGLDAARANLVPALLLQAVAVAIGLTYYYWQPARPLFERIETCKLHGGYLFSAVSTSFWAGLLPLLLQRWQRGARHEPLRRYPFFLAYWAFCGVMIDAFYRLQSYLWGHGADLSTLLIKDACDQFGFTPFLAIPLAVTLYAWKDADFHWHAARAQFGPGWFGHHVMPVLISAWAVWIPALIVIYAVPLQLQLPFQNIVECMWVLCLMVITGNANSTASELGLATVGLDPVVVPPAA